MANLDRLKKQSALVKKFRKSASFLIENSKEIDELGEVAMDLGDSDNTVISSIDGNGKIRVCLEDPMQVIGMNMEEVKELAEFLNSVILANIGE